jgi:hypothetical protein
MALVEIYICSSLLRILLNGTHYLGDDEELDQSFTTVEISSFLLALVGQDVRGDRVDRPL